MSRPQDLKGPSLQKQKSRNPRVPLAVAHLLLAALVAVIICLPDRKSTVANEPLLVGILLVEAFFLLYTWRRAQSRWQGAWIVSIWWTILLGWEATTTKLNVMHPVLVPTPEAVFNAFYTQWSTLLGNACSSLSLLAMGALTAVAAGMVLGLVVGWVPALRDVFTPIARVLAPIPSVVFAPYLVALMPTFRTASAMVIFLGVFWPTFLNMIIRVATLDTRILDSARMLELSSASMVFNILVPYMVPGVVSGLRVQLTSAIMMLTFAEMLGASAGMGYYIINYANFCNYVNVLAGIIVVGLVVTLLNWLITQLERHLITWH